MGLLLLPLGIVAGWLAGAAMSRRMVREEVQRLESRIENRNGHAAPAPAAPAPPAVEKAAAPAPAPATADEVAPEIILVLSAAVAAFLGKRARVRGARLVRTAPSNAWAQQGRVFVQASHNLGVMHGR
ncbi:MAG TPA: hypothetical protein VMT86_09405 [Bryobacteraceae bacterium]|nr:hypothetical protein [Bryobacteraceae bacterium]